MATDSHRCIKIVPARNDFRLLPMLCSLFLIFYLGVLLPSHHHDDGKEHDDCPLCVAQAQPAESAAVIALPPISYVTLETFAFCPISHSVEFRLHYHGRAPPRLTPIG